MVLSGVNVIFRLSYWKRVLLGSRCWYQIKARYVVLEVPKDLTGRCLFNFKLLFNFQIRD